MELQRRAEGVAGGEAQKAPTVAVGDIHFSPGIVKGEMQMVNSGDPSAPER